MYPDVAKSYNNMALVYDEQGDYSKALEYYQLALDIREAKFGKDHPSVATIYNNMALVYDNQGDYYKALEARDRQPCANHFGMTITERFWCTLNYSRAQ